MRKLLHTKYSKMLWVGVLLLALLVCALALSPGIKTKEKVSQDINYDAEKLYGYKTKYIGDASKVGNLTSNLPLAQYASGISLGTQKQPYEITVNYKSNPGEFSNINELLVKNAAIIFSLVENADSVIFNFNDGVVGYRYPFTREYVNWVLNLDIKEVSSTLEKFRDELLPAIMQQDWTNVELYVWREKGTKNVYYSLFPGIKDMRATE